MIIPVRLKVGAHVYEVDAAYTFKESTELAGQANHQTRHIRVAPLTQAGEPRPRSNIEQTFMHEVLHCVDLVYNAHALSEETIERLSEGLYQVFADNGLWRTE